ncbi:peptidase inhibitor family I36 protein [Streptomyces sp. NPDC017941]|uniref:peptidase inhibitor family I36 protein n=1 Tax=Streptomyces sp. NPDC017941 TaxID=3365018 RepID=UPI0037A80150
MRTTTRSVWPAGAAVLALTVAALAAALTAPTHAGAAGPGTAGPPRLGSCGPGELCLWQKPGFQGKRHLHELAGTDIESCIPLPAGSGAQSLANRTGRPVTTYQSAECEETAEFHTYPGGGTWVPESPYRVRAVKIWER